jgi:hypothetical protein
MNGAIKAALKLVGYQDEISYRHLMKYYFILPEKSLYSLMNETSVPKHSDSKSSIFMSWCKKLTGVNQI